MPHQITFAADTQIITTVFTGDVQPDEVAQVMIENLHLAQEHQAHLFLVNCVVIEDHSAFVIDNYQTGIRLAELAQELPHRLREAVILPRSPQAAENLRFLKLWPETGGLHVRTFETEDTARGRLLAA